MVLLDLHDSDQQEAKGDLDPLRHTAMHTGHDNFEQSHANPPAQGQELPHPSNSDVEEDWEVVDARPILPKAAFFMGDLRDGLSMVSRHNLMFCSCSSPTLPYPFAAMLKCFTILSPRTLELGKSIRFLVSWYAQMILVLTFSPFAYTHDS
jgi:hypothetical protein